MINILKSWFGKKAEKGKKQTSLLLTYKGRKDKQELDKIPTPLSLKTGGILR